MVRVVFVSSIFDPYTQGQNSVDLPASNVFQLVRGLEERFPGLGRAVEKRSSIAIDGNVVHGWSASLAEASEVTIFPKIAGG